MIFFMTIIFSTMRSVTSKHIGVTGCIKLYNSYTMYTNTPSFVDNAISDCKFEDQRIG
jgi:hypothetical protein